MTNRCIRDGNIVIGCNSTIFVTIELNRENRYRKLEGAIQVADVSIEYHLGS